MFDTLVKKIFGSQSDRDYKKSLPTVELVNQLADQMKNLSDNELQLKTAEFRQQLRDRVQKQNSRISEIEVELANDLEPEIRDRLNDELDELERSSREHEDAKQGTDRPSPSWSANGSSRSGSKVSRRPSKKSGR